MQPQNKIIPAAHLFNLNNETFNTPTNKIYKGVLFDSRSEMACAKLLELCVKDWKPVEGQTVHVPIGFKRTMDFRVGSYLIEFHPIQIFREFHSADATRDLMRALGRCGKQDRREIIGAITKELGIQYAKKRRFCMDFSDNPEVRESKLLVALTWLDFIDKVLPVVATEWLPHRSILAEQFFKWRK